MLIRFRWFPAGLALLTLTCADASGPPDDISGACQRERECAAEYGFDVTSHDVDECSDRLSAEYDDASSYGCGGAYADWVSCQATQRGNCRPPIISDVSSGADSGNADGSESVDPCQDAYDAFRRCQGKAKHDECDVVIFGGTGTCSIGCALFVAECSAPAGAGEDSSCTCDTGDKVGATFLGQCDQDSVTTNARSACQ